MAKDLIIHANRQHNSSNRDELIHSALQDFNLPVLSVDKLETGKSEFFRILRDCIVDVNVIQQIANTNMLSVEIPQQFQKLYSEGKVHFGDSSKVMGNYSPTLYDSEGKLIGHATLKENPSAIMDSLANLALYSSIQQIANEIEQIKSKVATILQGQKNDRYALITGAYSNYELLLDEGQKNVVIPHALQQIKTGLQRIHFDVNEGFNEMKNAPKNLWEYFWKGIVGNLNPFKAESAVEWETKSKQVLYEFYLYYKLLLLSDVLMNDMGQAPMQIINNHSDFNEMCKRLLDDNKLLKALSYSKGADCEEVKLLLEADNHYKALLNQEVELVKIELSQTDVKLLENKEL